MNKPEVTPKSELIKSDRKWTELAIFNVAGLPYHDYNPKAVKRGMEVKLFHEPNNPVSNRAIKIVTVEGTRFIGYVPQHETYKLHEAKRRGCKFFAFVNQHFPHNESHRAVWIRVKVLEPITSVPEGFEIPM